MALILSQIKQHFKSITFIIFCIVVVVFFVTQFHGSDLDLLKPPLEEDGYYGVTEVINELDEMTYGYEKMYFTLKDEEVASYPIGVYKGIKMSPDDLDYLQAFMVEMAPNGKIEGPNDIGISYDRYKTFLLEFDERMGGHTVFGPEHYRVYRDLTYDEALNEYNTLTQGDYSNAFARLAADYLGITAALFIPFLSAFVLLKDKREHTEDLIFSSPISSMKYVVSRYISLLCSIMTVYLVIGLLETVLFAVLSNKYGFNFEYLAFIKHILIWIFPTIMMVVAIPMLISVVFSNAIIALVIQFIMSYGMLSNIPLEGDVAWWHLFIRFNELGASDLFESIKIGLYTNRLLVVCLSLLLVSVTTFVWKTKRNKILEKGKLA